MIQCETPAYNNDNNNNIPDNDDINITIVHAHMERATHPNTAQDQPPITGSLPSS